MGGKGRRRREKNYKAAHGDQYRLPPPPKLSSVNYVPSKLRKIMAFTQLGSEKVSADSGQRNRGDGGGGNAGIDKKPHSNDEVDSKTMGMKRKDNDGYPLPRHEDGDEIVHSNMPEKKKKKRKRKQVNDMRFVTAEELGGVGLKRKERKKMRLKERKKKHKKGKAEEDVDFPEREEIRFGEIVEAPPKLVAVPKSKVLNPVQDASKERKRLEAVEAYRSRRRWISRPGSHLPPPLMVSSSLLLTPE